MSRHSDLMIARTRLRWLGEVRQMSAIGTDRRCSRLQTFSAVEGGPAVPVVVAGLLRLTHSAP
jgi:hypothetical protein